MIRTPRPYAFPVVKGPGTFRIFVLGESAAYGDPDPAYGFSRYLEVMLRERYPSVNFEVINTGITAINSHVILRIAKDVARYQPDLFIIYAGNNEVVGPYGPGTVLTAPAMTLPAIRASIFVRSTRLGQLVSKALRPKKQPAKQWRGMEMFLDRQVPADSPMMRHVYTNFESNLRDIVAAAQDSGARVIVSTVGTNLKDCAPFGSEHRKGLSAQDLEAWSARVQEGASLESSGAYREALQPYMAAAQIDPEYAELQFRIARCLYQLGDYKSAKEHFIRARDLDTLRFRADSRINQTIRSVAAKAGSRVELIDAAATFAQDSPNGIPGNDLLYEHVHMTPHGNYVLAQGFFSRIANMLPPEVQASATGKDAPDEPECERLLALTPYDRSRVAVEMLQRIDRPPFTNQLNHSEQVLVLAQIAQSFNESYEETVNRYEWALVHNPNDRMLHLRFALLLYSRDRQAAIAHFRMARPYDGFPVVTPDGMLVN